MTYRTVQHSHRTRVVDQSPVAAATGQRRGPSEGCSRLFTGNPIPTNLRYEFKTHQNYIKERNKVKSMINQIVNPVGLNPGGGDW